MVGLKARKTGLCLSIAVILTLVVSPITYTAVVISGKPDTENENFPFFIKQKVYDSQGSYLYIGSNEVIAVDADKASAVAAVGSGNAAVVPITPEKITLNNIADQDNPLYGQKINHMAMGDGNPFIVSDLKPNVVTYVRGARNTSRSLLEGSPLHDAASAVSPGIIGLVGLDDPNGYGQSIFFAAVLPNGGGSFGSANSVFVQGHVQKSTINIDEKTTKVEFSLTEDAFYEINTTSAALKIGSDLASIDNSAAVPVVMYGNNDIANIYSGFRVTGGPGVTDGARGVTLQGNGAVAPDAAIEADSIIGGVGADTQVSIHHLSGLRTSTQLDYLVVVGGVGAPAATGQLVHALPLVGKGAAGAGLLAKKDAEPVDVTAPVNDLQFFKTRRFEALPNAAGDLFASGDAKARVGGTATLPGDIVDLSAEKDTVYVAVGSTDLTKEGGLFYSQAIFDNLGRIMGWTDWRRTLGSTEQVFGMALDHTLGRFWFMPGTDPDQLNQLKRTSWETAGTGFEGTLNSLFDDLASGIQGLFDFYQTNNAFDQTPADTLSVVCATGYKRVALVQSGAHNGVKFEAAGSLGTPFESTDGTLNGFIAGVDSIVISGGVIDDIGPIVAAEIVSDATHSWLVVGGSKGLAVLANSDGTGWAQGTLQKNFVNLPATLQFKKIGNYDQIRKIIADGDKLYVLSSNQLVRIDVSAGQFNGTIGAIGTELASPATLPDSVGVHNTFFDCAVSGKFALIATSNGLLRVGNERDISTATGVNFVGWKSVLLPENVGPVTRLFVVSPTHSQNEFATTARGGNIYVLNAYTGYSQTRLYRFAVNGLTGGADISDTTFQLFNDFFVQGKPTFYLSRGDYRNYVVTDGTLMFMSRSAYFPTSKEPFVEVINPSQRTGVRGASALSAIIAKNLDGNQIGQMIHRTSSGSWLIPGSTLQVGA